MARAAIASGGQRKGQQIFQNSDIFISLFSDVGMLTVFALPGMPAGSGRDYPENPDPTRSCGCMVLLFLLFSPEFPCLDHEFAAGLATAAEET